MRMLPFFKPKKGFMMAGGGLETSSGGGGGGGGAGISFTDDETAVGTFGNDTLYCRKINIPDRFFTNNGQYEIPSSGSYKIKFAIGYVEGTPSGGYLDAKYIENRYFSDGNVIRLVSSTISSSEIVPNSGYAYIFYTKNS